jgi:hypothetical protein
VPSSFPLNLAHLDLPGESRQKCWALRNLAPGEPLAHCLPWRSPSPTAQAYNMSPEQQRRYRQYLQLASCRKTEKLVRSDGLQSICRS